MRKALRRGTSTRCCRVGADLNVWVSVSAELTEGVKNVVEKRNDVPSGNLRNWVSEIQVQKACHIPLERAPTRWRPGGSAASPVGRGHTFAML